MSAPLDLDAARQRSAALLATPPRHSSSCRKARESAADVQALCDEVERLRADVDRLRAQNKTAADERDKRHQAGERELGRYRSLMAEAREHHRRYAEDPGLGWSQYGLAGAALLIEENARLRAALRRLAAELDAEHRPDPELKGRGGCVMCWPKDGSWPCLTRMAVDEVRGVLDDEGGA